MKIYLPRSWEVDGGRWHFLLVRPVFLPESEENTGAQQWISFSVILLLMRKNGARALQQRLNNARCVPGQRVMMPLLIMRWCASRPWRYCRDAAA
ncbi:hypothetical protein [Erwinia tracheiphila]|uniref:hypothetical protein n=1 Tax=Erwinia tracheiphila TaxID=65700 RepID=UPI0003402419|nr:hypothetical protein ETR_20468 [Erwinia tracheiphila PSU-1]